MGVIRVDFSDELLQRVDEKMREVSYSTLQHHVEYFLQKTWICLLDDEEVEELTQEKQEEKVVSKNSKIHLPMYVQHCNGGYRFVKHFPKLKKCYSFQNKSLEVVLEFYEAFKETGFDYEQFNIIKDKFVAPKSNGYIYYEKSRAQYRIQKNIFSKDYTFLMDKSKDVLGPIRDYILWLSDEDKLQLYEDAKGQRPKKEYYLNRLKEDVEYQQYLENRKN